jgi:hypothetical protein
MDFWGSLVALRETRGIKRGDVKRSISTERSSAAAKADR